MAAVMSVRQVTSLLNEAVGRGCSIVWPETGTLAIGSDVGEPSFLIDFAQERLVRVGRADAENKASSLSNQADLPVSTAPARLIPLDPQSAAIVRSSSRQTGHYSLILEGKIIGATSLQALLLSALEEMERMRPGTLRQLETEKARTKRVVARRPEHLYEHHRLAKHAKPIEGGWWVATNNSRPEVEKYIRRAAFHAGLQVDIRP